MYLLKTKWNEGAKFSQHLVIELKRPAVRIVPKHVEQLERYARQIVKNPIFGQGPNSRRFSFVLVSSQVSSQVKETKYQEGEEPGLISRPTGLGHPTELWALQWSDYLDRRQEELRFLREKLEISAEPEALDYLRRTVPTHLPQQALPPASEDT